MVNLSCMSDVGNQNPSWISNYIHYKVSDEITYPFPNFDAATIEVSKWISNFIPYFMWHMITYPRWDYNQTTLVKGNPVDNHV